MANAKIKISEKKFGYLPVETKSAEWYEITPKSPISGTNIKVETTEDTHLEMACIQVFGEDDPDYDYEAGAAKEKKVLKKEATQKLKEREEDVIRRKNDNYLEDDAHIADLGGLR